MTQLFFAGLLMTVIVVQALLPGYRRFFEAVRDPRRDDVAEVVHLELEVSERGPEGERGDERQQYDEGLSGAVLEAETTAQRTSIERERFTAGDLSDPNGREAAA